jgi:uncharacterized protein involved in high-affinity Fe2+ transport
MLKPAWSAFAVILLALAPPAHATEYYVGDAVEKNNLVIEPNYLTGITMNKMPEGMAMGSDDIIHLEVDVHAAKGEPHGFNEKEWMPYLTIVYSLEKIQPEGGVKADMPTKPYHKSGRLVPMTANDGPHYANNVTLAGPGQYHLTYHFEPPSKLGFIRHVDTATGVPDWWPPFSLEWTFAYPGKAKEE